MSRSGDQDIRCANCDADLSAGSDEPPCPYCGSEERNLFVHVQEEVQIGESVAGTVRKQGASGRPAQHFQSRDDFKHSSQEWVRLERLINREDDRYYEKIVDKNGNVIREVDEPLSQHRGRGAAKNRHTEGDT